MIGTGYQSYQGRDGWMLLKVRGQTERAHEAQAPEHHHAFAADPWTRVVAFQPIRDTAQQQPAEQGSVRQEDRV